MIWVDRASIIADKAILVLDAIMDSATIDLITKILIGSGLLGAVVALIKATTDFVRSKVVREKGEQAVLRTYEVYDVLNILCSELNVSRALITFASNGGDDLHPGSYMYTNILYEIVREPGLNPIKFDIQRTNTDFSGVARLRELALSGVWTATRKASTTDDHEYLLKDGSKLDIGLWRSILVLDKAQKCVSKKLLATPKRFYVLAIFWGENTPIPTQEEIEFHTNAAVSRLVKLLE